MVMEVKISIGRVKSIAGKGSNATQIIENLKKVFKITIPDFGSVKYLDLKLPQTFLYITFDHSNSSTWMAGCETSSIFTQSKAHQNSEFSFCWNGF